MYALCMRVCVWVCVEIKIRQLFDLLRQLNGSTDNIRKSISLIPVHVSQ